MGNLRNFARILRLANLIVKLKRDALPWDREFPGTRHYSVGYLSYRLPTIMDVPEQTQVFVDSLEPLWFYGIKSFSETTIGAVPGASSNEFLLAYSS